MAKKPRSDFLNLSILATAVLAVPFALAGNAWAAEPYRLGVSDKINVRVVAWQAAETELEEWTAVGGEYFVGPTGTTAFPFVGETESAGKSTTELADTLSKGLQQALGLPTAPNVSIEIAEFGPIYVTGDVQNPGEYKFAPGLNVIKALSLAGGERRTTDTSSRAEKEVISANGTYDVLRDEHLRLLARRARLNAELANQDQITMPPELASQPDAEALIAVEQAVLEAHKRQTTSQISAIESQSSLVAREVETFQQKRESTERQLGLAQEQLTNVRALADDGLTLVSRVSTLETNVAELESRLLDIDMAVLQGRQDIGDSERERAEIEDNRVSELTQELQEVDAALAAAVLKISTQDSLIREAVSFSGIQIAGAQTATYSYAIIRQDEEIQADATTAVQAGDVVVARLVLSQ
jgi:polysaccharide biosynthesis/export protein ExoF